MDFKDCVQFANEAKVCFLATDDGGQPRVRAMGLFFADETGIYLQTGSMKDLSRQIQKNPRVELCFWKPGDAAGTMLRVEGLAEILDDLKLKTRALEERPFLRTFGLHENSPELIVFRVGRGKAHFWTMEDNLKPKNYIHFG